MSLYWGARIDGEVYGNPDSDAPWDRNVWNTFELHAGKGVSLLELGFAWGEFYGGTLDLCTNGGAYPLLSMEMPVSNIVNKSQDSVIREWARKAKAWNKPFFYRPGWEMNGDWFSWGRHPDYGKAWRRLKTICDEEGATNITWVWCVNRMYNSASNPLNYWPGAAYVDWVGIDGYNFGEPWLTPKEVFGQTLDLVKRYDKPIIICETGCTESNGNKAAWIKSLLTEFIPQHGKIKGLSWFNWNLVENGVRRDWQIESSSQSQAAFKDGISKGIYLSPRWSIPTGIKVPQP